MSPRRINENSRDNTFIKHKLGRRQVNHITIKPSDKKKESTPESEFGILIKIELRPRTLARKAPKKRVTKIK
jgi:hypothetical protein